MLVAAIIVALPGSSADLPTVSPNDNRVAAGFFDRSTLRVSIVAARGTFYPEGSGVGLDVAAFGEEGKRLQTPGPLLRVRVGTDVVATVRNAMDRAIVLRGLNDRAGGSIDSTVIAAGETREVRFTARTEGTFYYWGHWERAADDSRGPIPSFFDDGQMVGALIVDGPDARSDDRTLLIGLWVDQTDTVPPRRHTFLVNGLSWPHTERLDAMVGDTMRIRVINASPAPHPMHLHGFYYTVLARGDGSVDTTYSPAQQRLAVTETLRRGETMRFLWSPKRPGNWLFHCHFIRHVEAAQRMMPPAPHDHDYNHALDGMAGLITGIVVRPAAGGYTEPVASSPRKLRVYANARAGFYGSHPGLGFILQEGPTPPARDSIRIPGTPIFLRRDEPVEITVLNRTAVPISVHWHGIELESYYDGVPGWSGARSRVAPAIAPEDSFVVRMTPDRAGTFIYHTHADEAEQLASGLYAPLIILAPGERWDPETNLIFLMGQGGPGEGDGPAPMLLNGEAEPRPRHLKVGTKYRLRFINITPSENQTVRLLDARGALAEWRLYSKDGAAVPAHQAVTMPAHQFFGAGETYDFEFTPAVGGEFTLESRVGERRLLVPLVIR